MKLLLSKSWHLKFRVPIHPFYEVCVPWLREKKMEEIGLQPQEKVPVSVWKRILRKYRHYCIGIFYNNKVFSHDTYFSMKYQKMYDLFYFGCQNSIVILNTLKTSVESTWVIQCLLLNDYDFIPWLLNCANITWIVEYRYVWF